MVRAYHRHADAARRSPSGGDGGLNDQAGAGPAIVEQHGGRVLPRGARGGPLEETMGPDRVARRSSTPAPARPAGRVSCRDRMIGLLAEHKSQFTSPRFTELSIGAGAKRSMADRGRWLDPSSSERSWPSSSGSGGRRSTRACTSTPLKPAPKPAPGSASRRPATPPNARPRHSAAEHPTGPTRATTASDRRRNGTLNRAWSSRRPAPRRPCSHQPPVARVRPARTIDRKPVRCQTA